ncbi:CD209 antigen-like protein E isoform X1 [Acanthopagrus latus]|uniref:CD209 antigen-like protein E isoform X1 n=1 Tax=Acanthopagrus latus TaxID=8177 RepID=UPI00187C6D8F|nr:CD209 antigen-like protein E isoform X1 [Acanthopagrus latus]
MSEDLYVEPDPNKIVRFQAGDTEYMNFGDHINSEMVYENWSTARKSEDNTAYDQQKIAPTVTSVSASSGKRNLLRGAVLFLGLLCLVLLAVVAVLVVLWIKDAAKLTSERDKLQTIYSEMESLSRNLAQNISQLEKEKDLLKAMNCNLTSQREISCCPDKWIKFGNSCYSISTTQKNWIDSKKDCENHDAQLVIISSTEEQEFLNSFRMRTWIGLTDEDSEGTWKWVNGMEVEKTYWEVHQPDNGGPHGSDENCAEIHNRYLSINTWNDLSCSFPLNFICEKILW